MLNPNKNNSVIQMGYGVPVWLQIIGSVSQLLMVINCSVNIIIYLHLNAIEFLKSWIFCMPAYVKRRIIRKSRSELTFAMRTLPPRNNDSPNVINRQISPQHIRQYTIERLI